jgi:hypothetical protein
MLGLHRGAQYEKMSEWRSELFKMQSVIKMELMTIERVTNADFDKLMLQFVHALIGPGSPSPALVGHEALNSLPSILSGHQLPEMEWLEKFIASVSGSTSSSTSSSSSSSPSVDQNRLKRPRCCWMNNDCLAYHNAMTIDTSDFPSMLLILCLFLSLSLSLCFSVRDLPSLCLRSILVQCVPINSVYGMERCDSCSIGQKRKRNNGSWSTRG